MLPQALINGWFLFSNATSDIIDEAAMICWSIWTAHNELVWKQKSMTAIEVVKSAKMVLNQWKSAQAHKFDSLLGNNDLVAELWIKPNMEMIKVNVDAAIFEQERKFGFGWVARDHMGSVLDVSADCKVGRVSPELAELVGIKEVSSWIKTKEWSHVQVESDCLVAIQAIKSSVQMVSSFGLIVEDCRVLLGVSPNVRLCFVKRSTNCAAHCIARASKYRSGRSLGQNDLPPDFLSIVQNDLLS